MNQPDMPSHEALLEFAHILADKSQRKIMEYFRRDMEIDNKFAEEGFDPVTEADRSAEQLMRDLVAEHWPEHDFLGEEFENIDRNATYQWCVDPIDGTRAFIMGYPLWGTLIGLKKDGSPILGLMNQPFTGERFWAGDKLKTRYSGPGGERALKTRECLRIESAILSTTDPEYFEDGFERDRYADLAAQTRLNRYGGDCYAYCMLAAGGIDIVIEAGLKPFDIMALVPIINGAGGRITTWDGSDPVDGGRILATGDPRLHEKILKRLNA